MGKAVDVNGHNNETGAETKGRRIMKKNERRMNRDTGQVVEKEAGKQFRVVAQCLLWTAGGARDDERG